MVCGCYFIIRTVGRMGIKVLLSSGPDNLFPVLMKDLTFHLKSGTRLDVMVEEKINQWEPGQFESLFYGRASRPIWQYKLICTGIGMLTGIVIILTLIISGI